jgi:hypothetical protein
MPPKPRLPLTPATFRETGSSTAIRFPKSRISPLHRATFGSKPLTNLFTPRQISLCQTIAMSTMPASHGHSEACCNIPPVVATGYVPKGSYETLGGMKTCKYYHHAMCEWTDLIVWDFCSSRYHWPRGRDQRHHRRVRHFRIFPSDTTGSRYPRHRRQAPQV